MRHPFSSARLFASAPLLALCLATGASAATIAVDTTADVIDSSGDCSLREAVVAANTNTAVDGCAAGEPAATAVDVIELPEGTYLLTLEGLDETWLPGEEGGPLYVPEENPDPTVGDLDVLEDLDVIGAGPGLTRIAWGGVQGDRIFHAAPVLGDVNLGLSGLTLADGFVDVTVINPDDPVEEQWLHRRVGGSLAAGGGAIVQLRGESGPTDEGGPPDTHDEGEGGDAFLYLADVEVLDSYAEGGGGGISSGGDLVATGLVLQGNATEANGGGLYFEGALLLEGSALIDNAAEGGGGMFATGGSTGTIAGTLFQDNYATGGGAMSIRSLVVFEVVNTTVVGNEAFDVGGGLLGNGTYELVNSTVVGNRAGSEASFAAGGLVAFAGGTFELANTLIAGNLVGEPGAEVVVNCGCSGGGCVSGNFFDSQGYNLEDVDTCALDLPNDQASVDPMITTLGDHGGPLDTIGLLPGSPAVDAGAALFCPATDARGVERPLDGDESAEAVCDIGAFELSPLEVDGDKDGYCEGLAFGDVSYCVDGATVGDCDDAVDAVYPGNAEVCDGLDNDCANGVDDGLPFADYWPDADDDGYGAEEGVPVSTCDGAPAGYVDEHTDCNDAVAEAYPGADEYCNDIDDDCDGTVDEDDAVDAATWYLDADGDGFGVNAETAVACDQPEGFAPVLGDCDDGDADVNPDADEVFDNDIDDDCDGFIDKDDPEFEGCGCSTTPSGGLWLGGLLALGLLARRRR